MPRVLRLAPIARALCLCALAPCLVLPTSGAAAAQEAPLLVLVDDAVRVPHQTVRAAVAAELGRDVVGPPGTTHPHLEVSVDGERVRVRWAPEDGYAIERSMPLPSDDAALPRIIAMLAGNLVTDQAADALASLAVLPEAAEVPEVTEPPPEPPVPDPPRSDMGELLGDPSLAPPTRAPDLVGQLALSLDVGGMSAASAPLVLATVQGGIRWRELHVGLALSLGGTDVTMCCVRPPGGETEVPFPVHALRLHLVPSLAYEPEVGPVRLHFGGGLGLALINYSSIGDIGGARALVRITVGVFRTLIDRLEVFAMAWVGTWFADVPLVSEHPVDLNAVDGGITLGARLSLY